MSKNTSDNLIVDESKDQVLSPKENRNVGVNVSIDPTCFDAIGNAVHEFAEVKTAPIRMMEKSAELTEHDKDVMTTIIEEDSFSFEEKKELLDMGLQYKLVGVALTCFTYLIGVQLVQHGKNRRSIVYNIFRKR